MSYHLNYGSLTNHKEELTIISAFQFGYLLLNQISLSYLRDFKILNLGPREKVIYRLCSSVFSDEETGAKR